MDEPTINKQLLEMEARVLDALRSLSEVGDPESLRLNPAEIAGHEEALAQLGRALEQIEQLTSLIDATGLGATRH